MTIPLTALCALLALPLITGFAALLYCTMRRDPAPRTPGILFHDLTDAPRLSRSHVRTRTFESFIDRLHDLDWRTVSAAQGVASPSPRQTVLAFDDGLESCCGHAVRVLAVHGFTASFFPIVTMIGATGAFDVFGARTHASAARLRELIALGHEVGSHTITHPDCSRLGDAALGAELAGSRARLEDILGAAVTTISFPYGSCTPRVWACALEAGYLAGVIHTPRRITEDPRIIAVRGTWAFDTVDDILRRATGQARGGNSAARAAIMPCFARGTALWQFRREYSLFRY